MYSLRDDHNNLLGTDESDQKLIDFIVKKEQRENRKDIYWNRTAITERNDEISFWYPVDETWEEDAYPNETYTLTYSGKLSSEGGH